MLFNQYSSSSGPHLHLLNEVLKISKKWYTDFRQFPNKMIPIFRNNNCPGCSHFFLICLKHLGKIRWVNMAATVQKSRIHQNVKFWRLKWWNRDVMIPIRSRKQNKAIKPIFQIRFWYKWPKNHNNDYYIFPIFFLLRTPQAPTNNHTSTTTTMLFCTRSRRHKYTRVIDLEAIN